MATLSGSTIASTYDRLLALPSGGLNGATLVAITDGNASATCALSVATTSIAISATDKFYFDDGGNTYIHEAAADRLDFVVGGDTDGFVLKLDTTTKVGIGTAAPGEALEIKDGDLYLHNDDTASGSWSNIHPGITIATKSMADDGYGGAIYFASTDPHLTTTNPKRVAGISWQASEDYTGDSDSGARLCFFTTPNNAGTNPTMTQTMTIDEDGKVGIGTTAPSGILHIGATGTANMYIDKASADANSAQIVFRKTRGTTVGTAGTTLSSGDLVGEIYFMGSDSNSFETGAKITCKTTEAWSNGAAYGSKIEFYTVDDTTTGLDLALTIDEDKVVSGELNDTSDIAKKQNIESVDSGLNIINALRGVTFEWKHDGRKSQGFIAQEVEKILPHCVTGDNYVEGECIGKAISTSGIVASAVKAIQELSAKVEALENA